jgi:hypothetical protein
MGIMKNSPYSENELLEIASKFKKHLKDHFDTIKSACPGLDIDFISRFKALYYEVRSHSLNPAFDNLDQIFRLELEEFANQVRILFPIFRFYMNKAFPYDSRLWEAYGYCEIEKVVHDYSSLRTCLEGSVKLINEKRNELRSANCPDRTLDEIVRLTKQIAERHDEISAHYEKQNTMNKVHNIRLNELFSLMEMVHNASTRCFQNDPESLKQLTFPSKEPESQNQIT